MRISLTVFQGVSHISALSFCIMRLADRAVVWEARGVAPMTGGHLACALLAPLSLRRHARALMPRCEPLL